MLRLIQGRPARRATRASVQVADCDRLLAKSATTLVILHTHTHTHSHGGKGVRTVERADVAAASRGGAGWADTWHARVDGAFPFGAAPSSVREEYKTKEFRKQER